MNRHNLPLPRHAANEYRGCVKIVKRFRLSYKHMIYGGREGDSIYQSVYNFLSNVRRY